MSKVKRLFIWRGEDPRTRMILEGGINVVSAELETVIG